MVTGQTKKSEVACAAGFFGWAASIWLDGQSGGSNNIVFPAILCLLAVGLMFQSKVARWGALFLSIFSLAAVVGLSWGPASVLVKSDTVRPETLLDAGRRWVLVAFCIFVVVALGLRRSQGQSKDNAKPT